MPTVIFISPDGTRHEVDAIDQGSAMAAAVDNLIPGIVGECGGELACASCHVYVESPWEDALPSLSPEEDDLLDGTACERSTNSRLACQLPCIAKTDGMVLLLPTQQ
jgi:2Fe-2S ferredoxin